MELHFNTNGNEKQKEAARRWIDDTTDQILFGGAKYGGKSYLGANLIFGDAMLYPDTYYFIARSSLTDIRKFTIPTIHEVYNSWNLDHTKFLKYNGQDNFFTLPNKSRVYLIDGSYMPSDPDYHRFGSMQFTRGWCEEIGGMHPKAISNLFLTVGRWKNAEYGLKKKLLLTCNPHKGYGYSEFYKPSRDGILPESKAFIISLPQDNKSGDPDYIRSLRDNPDKNERERLYYGNWEYSDDPADLMDYDSIIDLFSNTFVEKGESYITADIARFGRDSTVIIVWSGLRAEHIYILSKESTTDITKEINRLRDKYKVPLSRIIVDEDGVGGGVCDQLECHGFVNNSRPEFKENFANLKSQCYFKLADIVNAGEMYVNCNEDTKIALTEELEQVKQKDMDKDGKKAVVGKDKVKELIGRSPDISDALMMRMYYELEDTEFAVV